MKPIHVLKPGRHGGREWTPETLRAIADAYDAALHEAPIVVGHPRMDDPAYGWVGRLRADADGLFAEPRDVDASFAEAVRAGRYRKVSVSLYPPGVERNPRPEGWYLRHVGFLGARPPVVKGLRQVELGEDGDAVVLEFGEPERALARVLRRLRDWVIEKGSLEEADRVLPQWEIENLADAEDATAVMSEPEDPEEETMPPEKDDAARREAELAEREAALQRREAEAALAADRREALEFAEKQTAAGRIPPADRDALADVLAALPGDAEIELAEDGGRKSARAVLRGIVERLPAQIDYGERAPAADGQPAAAAATPLPDDWTHPPDDGRHRRVLEYAEQHGTTYEEAAARVADRR